jgi:hypothetical protein
MSEQQALVQRMFDGRCTNCTDTRRSTPAGPSGPAGAIVSQRGLWAGASRSTTVAAARTRVRVAAACAPTAGDCCTQ